MKDAADIDDISARWLTEKLGYEVRDVEAKKVGTGQTGASYRLTLDADQGPATLLAKVAAGDLDKREKVKAGYAAEVGFYDQLVSTLDIRTPECHFAAISDDQLHFTLLLEDLAPRVPGVQAEGCSTERAEAALGNLAGLHAPRWNDASLYDLDFLMNIQGKETAEFLREITVGAAGAFVDRYANTLGEEDSKTIKEAASAIGDWILLPQKNFAVLHGDYRLDNLMFGESNDDVVALDWQTVGVGGPGRDLAYFLGTCLKTEQRRRAEDSLVTTYHRELQSRGIDNYSLEECFRDYRLGLLQATMITTLGCMGATGERSDDSDAMFLAMATRSSAAIRDHKTLDLL